MVQFEHFLQRDSNTVVDARVDDPGETPHGGGTPATQDLLPALHGRLLSVSRLATIGEMAAGVAHELNQPLTAIATYAQACKRLLLRTDIDRAQLDEALQEIATQATRAGEIIRRLRTLARSHPTARVPLAVNSVTQELTELLQADARTHDAHLTWDLAPELPQIMADPAQIQQIILNFVRNSLEALAARPSDREIVVRTSLTRERQVEIAILDNGPGLPPELLSRVFDPFFSTKATGTGLGLAMSHTIARDHGGEIGYRPNLPHGACFYIHLPEYVSD